MTVTDVQPQKNNASRVSVFVDGKYSFSLDGTDALRLKIKKGRELSENDIASCIMECNYSKAREKAFDVLSRRPLSKKELAEKLGKYGYDKAVITEVINELESLGYIDDSDYASLFLEHCHEKMWGEKKIRYEMSMKGISAQIVDELLASVNEYDRLDEIKEMIITKYSGRNLSDIKTKAAVTRYFASRGFEFSLINSALSAAIKELSDE